MKNINKCLVLICFIWFPIAIVAQDQEQEYLLAEQNRILQAQDVEKNIDSYINTNIANYTLNQSDIDEITNGLGNEYGGNQNIPPAVLSVALTDAKKGILRENYLSANPSVLPLFEALPFTGTYRQRYCLNPGFENIPDLISVTGSYAFRTRRFATAATRTLMQSCATQQLNIFGTTPNNPSNAGDRVSIITANVPEPTLNAFMAVGTAPTTVFNGSNSIKLNDSSGNCDITSMRKNFTIDDPDIPPTIILNFLLLMQNGHPNSQVLNQHAFFSVEVFPTDNTGTINGPASATRCVRGNDPAATFTANGITIATNGQLIYTPTWQSIALNLPTTGIGSFATIIVTVGDCNQGGHYATVYLDDICLREACPATLTITAPVLATSNGESEEASNWIRASNVVNMNAMNNNTIYHAANFVELNPGFEAMVGSRFAAYPLGCTNTFAYRQQDVAEDASETTTNYKNVAQGSDQLKIYPNPSNSTITILNDSNKLRTIMISSVDGKLILLKTTNSHSEQIDVSGFRNGLYLVTVENDDGKSIVNKFIKN
ncbi:T9SS type A sorting domain-containing protein [Flavobacterium sp.]|uniref:T9SS type A sorting domain-containing protein n=1 Tax=Flavobacterium sp. TaxID=239 RepID=UPI00286CBF1A|nr:T9SS type A sorting domain-containing protein [Flavobacterium sp.]